MTSRASSQREMIRDLAKVLAREKEEIQSPGLTCRGTRHSGNWKDRTGFERELFFGNRDLGVPRTGSKEGE